LQDCLSNSSYFDVDFDYLKISNRDFIMVRLILLNLLVFDIPTTWMCEILIAKNLNAIECRWIMQVALKSNYSITTTIVQRIQKKFLSLFLINLFLRFHLTLPLFQHLIEHSSI
jgi:hypothetical protein